MTSRIAKATLRQELWTALGLTDSDGTHWRNNTLGETIVLSLKPHVDTTLIPSVWNGFRVDIVPYDSIRVHV